MSTTERELLDGTDVQRALREVAAHIALGKPGLVLCRGPGGYALIAGAVGKATVLAAEGGHIVALSLNDVGLDALIQRACELRVARERADEGKVIS
jgi:hypothetical protein